MFFKMTRDGKVMPLIELAKFCLECINDAEKDGVKIDDGNVVDLIADNSDAPLVTIREALVVAGLSHQFPNATSCRMRDGAASRYLYPADNHRC
jgi:hypothetical protein